MKVLCINGEYTFTTTGEVYEVIKIGTDGYFNELYYILTNNGDPHWFKTSQFKKISEIRDEKLNKLGL